MKCAYCGAENKDGYKFCQKCGAQLESKSNNVSQVKVKKEYKSTHTMYY